MIIMMQRCNVAEESGGNRVWSLEQSCGKPRSGDLASRRLIASHVLRERFDALLVLDREVKHEACPVAVADDAAGPAIRDVLTIEVRRPRGEGKRTGRPTSRRMRGGHEEGAPSSSGRRSPAASESPARCTRNSSPFFCKERRDLHGQL